MFDGSKLEKILSEKGLSFGKFADDVGVSKMFISYLVRGFKQPSMDTYVRICCALNVNLDELIKAER